MRMSGNRQSGIAAAAISLIFGVCTAGAAEAATCKDELDRFERRLHSSTLASTDPDTFQTLARQAEEAAGLRDEQQCLQTVAALNEALPVDPGPQVAPGLRDDAARANPRRPAPPVLMIAGGAEDEDEAGEERETAGARSDRDDKSLEE